MNVHWAVTWKVSALEVVSRHLEEKETVDTGQVSWSYTEM